MSDKLQTAKTVAREFPMLDNEARTFVLGYITGKQEERAKYQPASTPDPPGPQREAS